MHPALTKCLTGAAHVMCCTYQVLERVFEEAVEVTPVSGVQLQTMQNLSFLVIGTLL